MKKTIHFVGIVANVDETILDVPLEHGFKIESVDETEGLHFLAALENLDEISITGKLIHILFINNKKMYFVKNSYEVESDSWTRTTKFDNELLHGYLIPIFRLMRLFKEGNVCVPYHYYYEKEKSKVFMSGGTILFTPRESFSLKDSEVPALKNFIQKTQLPFKQSFVQLAFDNFELSYQVLHPDLAFLSLMISLEILFNPGESEIRYRISRNTASLLAKDRSEFNAIFSEIKRLYDKRSSLIHSGKKEIQENDVSKLRYYVRESIKEINRLDKDKEHLLEILNARGFEKN